MTTKQKALGYLCDIETRLNTFDGTYSWGLEIQTLRAALEAQQLPAGSKGLGSRIHAHFARLGGVELELPERSAPPTH